MSSVHPLDNCSMKSTFSEEHPGAQMAGDNFACSETSLLFALHFISSLSVYGQGFHLQLPQPHPQRNIYILLHTAIVSHSANGLTEHHTHVTRSLHTASRAQPVSRPSIHGLHAHGTSVSGELQSVPPHSHLPQSEHTLLRAHDTALQH